MADEQPQQQQQPRPSNPFAAAAAASASASSATPTISPLQTKPKRKMGPQERAARKALREEYARRAAEAEERRRNEPAPVWVPKPVGGCHVFFHPDLGIGVP
ncbi:hypothetical protein NLG97_g8968 [Lecanicillium saksenae]|uniref:Uncharacterized protein n=1 Tax=Lecanicillium saksenae TaxID=468837 RepID=A0ACC1QIT2_9HYPO|nr:hypothetical protein NLG97_g8968 [Lecanicillium saksenae]